jgi:hypothetical protein
VGGEARVGEEAGSCAHCEVGGEARVGEVAGSCAHCEVSGEARVGGRGRLLCSL